jgi:hypothetical protein
LPPDAAAWRSCASTTRRRQPAGGPRRRDRYRHSTAGLLNRPPPPHNHAPRTPPAHLPTCCRATAKLLGAALDGSSDLELGSPGISASFIPSWVHKSEKLKAEMTILRERLNKLKE